VGVRLDGPTPDQVYLAPERTPLPFRVEGGYVNIDLPPLGPHAVIVLE